MLKPTYTILFICLLVIPCAVSGIKITRYSTQHGLRNTNIYCSFIDQSGLLWVGGETGLHYFDGNRFQPVDLLNGRFGIEGSPLVMQGICEDHQGHIYFATYDHGIFIYDKQNRSIRNLNIHNTPALASNQFLNVNAYGKQVFFSGANGVTSYQYPEGIQTVSKNKSPGTKMCIDGTLHYEIHETDIFVQDQERSFKVSLPDNKDFISEATIFNHQLYCTAKCGVYTIENKKLSKQAIRVNGKDFSNGYYLGVGTLGDKQYLLSYHHGAYWIDSIHHQTLYCSPIKPDADSNVLYNGICKDEKRQTLILSTNQGVHIYELETPALSRWAIPDRYASAVMCIQACEHGFYAGSQKGLLHYDTNSHQYQSIALPIKNEFINVIYPYNKGYLIGTHGGFYCMNQYSIFTSIPEELRPYLHFSVQGMVSIHNKTHLFYDQHTRDVLLWDQEHHVCTKVSNIPFQGTIQAVLKTDTNHILFAGRGLFLFNVNTLQVKSLQNSTFADVFFTDLVLKNQIIYASTFSSGIFTLNAADYSVTSKLDKEHGLLSEAVYNLQLGQQGVWYSCSKGIGLIRNEKKAIQNFVPSEGFEHSNFDFRGSGTIGRFILFGQTDGIACIDEDKIKENINNPEIHLLEIGITSSGKYTPIHLNTNALKLKYNQNDLLLHVTSNDYVHPEYNHIYYRLNQSSWIPVSDNNLIALNELSDGDFLVEFTHNPFSKDFISTHILSITILPPWYRTPWFYIGFILTLGMILAAILRNYYQNRLQQQRLVIDKLHAVNKERERINADLHDDMGGNVAAIQMLSASLNKVSHEEDRKHSITELIYHTAQLSQKMKDVVWAFKTENDTLESLLLYIRKYCVRELDSLGFSVKFTMTDVIPNCLIPGEKRKNIFYVVKEVVNNIIKHSKATEVNITIDIIQEELNMVIRDNGIGLPAQPELGNGIKLMEKRLDLYGGKIQFDSIVNKGVCITIEVPIHD